MEKHYQISEYGSFTLERSVPGCVALPERTFRALEEFALYRRGKDADGGETDTRRVLTLSVRPGVGRVITVQSFVGVIALRDGTVIEILPKLAREVPAETGRRLVMEMLRSARETPHQSFQMTQVGTEKMDLLEVFVRMFLDEVFRIVKRGLRSGYETVEENAAFLRGRLLFDQQLRRNAAHKERSFVAYDDYTLNRPENRVLKAALLHLYRRSASARNRRDIRTLLAAFGQVEPSADVKGDLARCVPDRNMKDYVNALAWSRVFLLGLSFAPYAGTEVALALLFPMEELFERYIARLLRTALAGSDCILSAQDSACHLFEYPERQFALRPDLVVRRRSDGAVFVLDTKWKLLDSARAHYGIQGADMYQMYVYQKKYAARHITLIYPKTERVDAVAPFRSKDGATVRVAFIDLLNARESAAALAAQLQQEN